MKFLEAIKIYEKYDPNKEAEKEFKRKTIRDTGAVKVELRLRLYSEFLNKKWIELRNNRLELVKKAGKCCDFQRISKVESYLHDECSFINLYPRKICEPCEFYQEKIKPLDISMEELREAGDSLEKEANYDDTWY